MEALTFADLSFLTFAVGSASAYLLKNYVQHIRQGFVEPLVPPKVASPPIVTRREILPPTRSISKSLRQANRQCMVFYGSQTGTAERLAIQFSKEAKTRFGLECLVGDLDDYDYDDLLSLSQGNAAVFFLATYGEGEATDNAVAFDQYLKTLENTTPSSSASLCYGIFGLGNTSYQYYNKMAKRLCSTFSRHSASQIGALGLGDDGKGTLEEDYISWKDDLLPQLALRFGLVERAYAYEPLFSVSSSNTIAPADTFLGEVNKRHLRNKVRGPYTLENPYPAPLTRATELQSGGARRFLHLEVDLSGSTLSYEAGDHLAIRPVNSDLEIDRFLRCFGLIDDRHMTIDITSLNNANKVPVPAPSTYDAIVRYYLDISGPVSRRLLAILVDFAPTDHAKSRLQHLSTNVAAFQSEVANCRLNLAQVLGSCSGAARWKAVPFSALLENMAVLKPRYYSISSSPLVSRKTVAITTVVETARMEGTAEDFKGVATNYLLALQTALQTPTESNATSTTLTHQIYGPRQRYLCPTLLCSIGRSNFKLPRDSSLPVIMIGPGTGVAPYRGFVQSRASNIADGKQVGRTMLFYGCRSQNEDFLYQAEWQQYAKTMPSEVFSMHVAFSRQQGRPKTYVQHLFAEHADELRELILSDGAFVYVCGDAKRMARDVFRTMTELLSTDGQFNGSTAEAENYLINMKSERRWLEDVW